MPHVELTLIGKPGCHLCDEARAAVERVRGEMLSPDRAGGPVEIRLEELDILEDEKLARLHAEDIPVVLVNGRRHAIWRVDPAKLTAAVEKAARPRLLRRR